MKFTVPLYVLTSLIFSIFVSLNWTQFHQKPKNYSELVSVKTTMNPLVAHGNLFADSRNALYLGRLDLGAWHGHNEMRWWQNLSALGAIDVNFKLERQAFLEFVFRGLDQSQTVVRLSTNIDWGSEIQKVNSSGRIEDRQSISTSIPSEVWLRLRLAFPERGSGIVELDGQKLAQFIFQEPYQFSFRNGARSAWIDKVTLTDSQGSRIADLSFWGSQFFWPAFCFVFLSTLFVLSGALKWFTKFRLQVLYSVYLSALLLSVVWFWNFFYESKFYRVEHSFRQITVPAKAENSNPPIIELSNLENYLPQWGKLPLKDVYEVLFVGGSQTKGEGASELSKTWMKRAEEIVQSAIPKRKFNFINRGESGAHVGTVLKKFREEWIQTKPDFVIINFANNDVYLDAFTQNISAMLETCKNLRILPILMLEGNTPEFDDAFLLEKHRILISLAEKYRVPYFNNHQFLKLNSHSGFLWWDHVHLTDYGQDLLAKFFSDNFQVILAQRGVR